MIDEDDKDGCTLGTKIDSVTSNVRFIADKPSSSVKVEELHTSDSSVLKPEYVKQYAALLTVNTKLLKEVSDYRFAKYTALLQAGFSESQALDLCKQVP